MFVEPTKAQRTDEPLRRLNSHGPAYLYRDDCWETQELKEHLRRVEGRERRILRYAQRRERGLDLFED